MTLQSACRSDYWWRALPGICLIYVGAGTEQYWFVAGVDTHARTHTLAVIDSSSGRQVDTATFPAPAAGSASAAIWLTRRNGGPSAVTVSMEGTGSYGAKLRKNLVALSFRVVESAQPEPSGAP